MLTKLIVVSILQSIQIANNCIYTWNENVNYTQKNLLKSKNGTFNQHHFASESHSLMSHFDPLLGPGADFLDFGFWVRHVWQTSE